jgi:hypothetical protein
MTALKGYRLTPTDYTIFHELREAGHITLPQLREEVLKDYTREHSWSLLKKLVNHGYLSECKGDGGKIVGWRINGRTKEGRSLLTSEVGGFEPKVPTYRTALDHDVGVWRLKKILSQAKAIEQWVPEFALRSEIMRQYGYLHRSDKREKLLSIPDAVLHLRTNGDTMKVALELELTRKARRLIYEKIESYVVCSDYQFVLYIARGQKLLSDLKEIYQEVLAKSWRAKIAKVRNGIYFAELDSVHKDGIHAKFIGNHNAISLSEIS